MNVNFSKTAKQAILALSISSLLILGKIVNTTQPIILIINSKTQQPKNIGL